MHWNKLQIMPPHFCKRSGKKFGSVRWAPQSASVLHSVLTVLEWAVYPGTWSSDCIITRGHHAPATNIWTWHFPRSPPRNTLDQASGNEQCTNASILFLISHFNLATLKSSSSYQQPKLLLLGVTIFSSLHWSIKVLPKLSYQQSRCSSATLWISVKPGTYLLVEVQLKVLQWILFLPMIQSKY